MVMPRSFSMSIESSICSLMVAQRDRAGLLDQPVGQRTLAVVDVRDDGEVGGCCRLRGRPWRGLAGGVAPREGAQSPHARRLRGHGFAGENGDRHLDRQQRLAPSLTIVSSDKLIREFLAKEQVEMPVGAGGFAIPPSFVLLCSAFFAATVRRRR